MDESGELQLSSLGGKKKGQVRGRCPELVLYLCDSDIIDRARPMKRVDSCGRRAQ